MNKIHPCACMSARFSGSQILFATLGVMVAVSLLALVASSTPALFMLGSFGASALLLFVLPEAPLSQPRSVVLGHISASAIALGCLALFGPQWWAVGLATGSAIGFMMLTRTVHPPAGSNAIIVFLAKPSWGAFLGSTLFGAVLLIVLAFVYHRTTRRHHYPLSWRAVPAPAR
jgi:CBS-domain-containing membrane protein